MNVESIYKRFVGILSYKIFGTTVVHRKCQRKGYKNNKLTKMDLKSIICINDLKFNNCNLDIIKYVTKMYLSHRFDYLGSGWVRIGYGISVLGVEGYCYLEKYVNEEDYFQSMKKVMGISEYERLMNIRSNISNDYQSICWNRDFKCGYSWGIDYIDEVTGISTPEGADIKTVWELGRLQFLLQLAVGALVLPNCCDKHIFEFKNVILDFLSANPVGIGVNWMLSMDVAIRATNILLAFDILKQLDKKNILDEEFTDLLTDNIYQHGRFIYDNLEVDILKDSNGNHYYSNIIGLLYISTYMDCYGSSKKWYEFAKKEYLKESNKQFFADGGNIEASTSYHRLVSEMMIFGAAVLIRNGEIIHEDIKCKITNAVYLTKVVTKKNGNIVQIGDNDSGRLINSVMYGSFMNNIAAEKFYDNLKGYSNIYGEDEEYFDENILCHNSMINYYNGLYSCEELIDLRTNNNFETSLIRAITKKEPEISSLQYNYQLEINNNCIDEVFKFRKESNFEFKYDINDKEIQWGYFPEFGVFYYKNSIVDFYLYTGGENGRVRIGHSHNDILHCELNVEGEDILFDRGRFLYTALMDDRDLFRSIKSHFVPDYDYEFRELKGVFGYSGTEKVNIQKLNANTIKIRYETETIHHNREVGIGKGKIIIIDEGNAEFKLRQQNCWYSNGYGKIIKL